MKSSQGSGLEKIIETSRITLKLFLYHLSHRSIYIAKKISEDRMIIQFYKIIEHLAFKKGKLNTIERDIKVLTHVEFLLNLVIID